MTVERVLICGSRTFSDEAAIAELITGIWHCQDRRTWSGLTIVHGDAKGADSLAKTWVKRNSVTKGLSGNNLSYLDEESHPAEWHVHHPDWCPGDWCRAKSYCVVAGPRRNQEMLDLGVNRAYAFVDKPLPKSRGTTDMVTRLGKAGVLTRVIRTGH